MNKDVQLLKEKALSILKNTIDIASLDLSDSYLIIEKYEISNSISFHMKYNDKEYMLIVDIGTGIVDFHYNGKPNFHRTITNNNDFKSILYYLFEYLASKGMHHESLTESN